eukprot:gb/GECG01008198.1/.p1 GENE.gb/GECG01008198.1/~~gb/GECG01008198.1/.p1  ORF type:complete len:461 (+),score=25.17 gb/GECG01008198.1/:1-1383(+)
MDERKPNAMHRWNVGRELDDTHRWNYLVRSVRRMDAFSLVNRQRLETWYTELERRYDSETRQGYRRALGLNMLTLILDGRMYGRLVNRNSLLYHLEEVSESDLQYLEECYHVPPYPLRRHNDSRITSFIRHTFLTQVSPLSDILRLCSWNPREHTENLLRRSAANLDIPWRSPLINWQESVRVTTSGKVTVFIRRACNYHVPGYEHFFRTGPFDKVYIQFEGTECGCCSGQCFKDWTTNIHFCRKNAGFHRQNLRGVNTHRGYIERFKKEWNDISQILTEVCGENWAERASEFQQREQLAVKGTTFICVGHSLGGALAQLCGLKLWDATDTHPVVFTLNSPRIFDHRTVTMLDNNRVFTHYRSYHVRDVIQRSPPRCLGFEHYADQEIPIGRGLCRTHARAVIALHVNDAFHDLNETLNDHDVPFGTQREFINHVVNYTDNLANALYINRRHAQHSRRTV